MRKTTNELYSGDSENGGTKVGDEEYEVIKKHAERISKYPIYYVDSPGTVSEIQFTIKHFQETMALDKWLLVILDHTLLTRGNSGDKEREVLYELQKVFMEAKKIGITTILQVSQMNREIESSERIANNYMHYPMRKDIFGGDSVFQASDYVVVLHRPELLGIEKYGPSEKSCKDIIFMHFLKVREGEPKILRFLNNLKYNSIEEYDGAD
jgi:replicative DNA helicase